MFFFLLFLIAAALALYYRGLAMTDPLTGLYNRRALDSRRRFYAGKSQLTALYFDIDQLKQVNDQQGHPQGDRLLVQLAQSLKEGCGKEEWVFRLGGDEFLLLSIQENPKNILARWGEKDLPASWGAATGPGRELDSLISQAEQAMYANRKQKKENRP